MYAANNDSAIVHSDETPRWLFPAKKKAVDHYMQVPSLTSSPSTSSDTCNNHPQSKQQTSTLNMKDRNGWDGKLRIDDPDNRRAILTNPEALEDPDYSDDDAPPVEEIDADEGASFLLDSCVLLVLIARSVIDLLEDESPDAEVRLTYCGVASFLRTRRWQELQVPEYTNNGCEGYRSDTFTNIQYRCAETRTIHQA